MGQNNYQNQNIQDTQNLQQQVQQQQNQLANLTAQYQQLLTSPGGANTGGQYSPLLSPSVQNPDGSWTAPQYQSILDPTTGLLEQPYILNDTLDTSALDELQKEALRDPGTASAWLTLSQNANNANTAKQVSDLAAQQNAQEHAAYDNLAAQGGLSSGARERIAQNSLNDMLRQKQDIQSQGNQANLNLATQDEQNRLQTLSTLPGLQLSAAQYGSNINEQNIQNALAERNQTYQSAMDAWKQKMQTWGANKQADAQAQTSSGGGKK